MTENFPTYRPAERKVDDHGDLAGEIRSLDEVSLAPTGHPAHHEALYYPRSYHQGLEPRS